ncbi:alpha/beta hydrolase [Phragmitibacter flavus]|uniref:Alpha/beta hydrolase n=1 Tax=Phragmitibacter flavus TaxID=2576071 RepID=A0A5R8K8C9_9BACT|nr:alpha/beta hydrolase [Phragmitibacter flavus]TLD68588.1 alpha/beta hydrolase [Phragmitibacter flavus]
MPKRRRFLLVCIALSALAGLFVLSKTHADKPKPPDTILFEPNIVFGKGGDDDLKLDLARPKKIDGKAPALVVIHGGGWISGDRSSLHPLLFGFANAGVVCISIQYRLAPQAKFPAQIEDVKCAVRWLRANADQYQIDPNRIGAIGMSAGAHLAILLAVTPDQKSFEGTGGHPTHSSQICTAVGIAGPYDLTLGYASSVKQSAQEGPAVRSMLESFLSGNPDQVPDQYRDASPINYVRKDKPLPPLQLLHGEADTLVLVEQADVMAKKLREAGAMVDYLRISDATHGTFGKDQDQHLLRIFQFLRTHLKLPGA